MQVSPTLGDTSNSAVETDLLPALIDYVAVHEARQRFSIESRVARQIQANLRVPSSPRTVAFISRAPEFLPIEFIIVGGGVGGLTASIALSRLGHRVTVLDENNDWDQTQGAGGCRLAPNVTKIYYRWGMEEKLKKIGVVSQYIQFADYETGRLGANGEWVEDFQIESGGEFLSLHYADFRKLLYDTCVELGVKVRGGAKVTQYHVRPERPSVTLASGEEVHGDVLIAADGRMSLSRQLMLGDRNYEKLQNVMVFNAVVPMTKMAEDPDLDGFLHEKQEGTVFSWFGEDRGALGFPTAAQGRNEFCLHTFAPSDWGEPDTMLEVGRAELVKSVQNAEPRLRKLAELASTVIAIPVVERPHIDEWLHPDGSLLVIGEAAHPLTTGSLYAITLAVEDAMMLGRLFHHLHRRDQIGNFLTALAEKRQARVRTVEITQRVNPLSIALPPGVDQARYLKAAVENMTAADAVSLTQDAIRVLFAYDPEDEADDWWVQWGLLQERHARLLPLSPGISVDVEKKNS
ncbi:FAD/NAD(P)-binding domain-containing protein [Laetiporus sulphureus 93-53]|uniref:FAD/NAD(P)-binding domain-containing protein n=1 Tax=Laetiporus sulphureus 93-53 TaxID=1314785 RepID=A0A165DDG3_9APHY|nr:FAD/NAD(P)-binding domain-containing protein [Laetiporus sulphureus 93-53]KZT04630.1 FAD/NAD(P)-binding domain-containing protein [Laetiporus sulphureus 93-53]